MLISLVVGPLSSIMMLLLVECCRGCGKSDDEPGCGEPDDLDVINGL